MQPFRSLPWDAASRFQPGLLRLMILPTLPVMPNFGDERQARRIKVALAILGGAGFAFPLLAMLWYRASPLVIGAESLGVRFLLSERILHREGPSAWVWQGFFTSAVQTGILAVMDFFSHASPQNLESRTSLYAYAYLILVALGGGATFFIAARLRSINPAGMALLVLAAIGPIFLTKTIGFYYFTLPDYYVLNVLFVAVAVLLFQHWSVAAAVPEGLGRLASTALGAGLLLGFMIANKLTMLAVGIVPVAALLLRPPIKFPAVVVKLAAIGIAAPAGFRFILWALYRFNTHDASLVLRKLSPNR